MMDLISILTSFLPKKSSMPLITFQEHEVLFMLSMINYGNHLNVIF